MQTFPGIMPSPELQRSFHAAGNAILPLREFLGDEKTLVCFSDYREDGAYATSTLFVTTLTYWDALASRLGEVRASHRVQSGSFQYKNRRDWRRLWPSAIEPWLMAFRDTPSLTVCVGYSKVLRRRDDYRAFVRNSSSSFEQIGAGITAQAA